MPLTVAIPDSSLVDCNGLREKTVRAGQFARAFAVFRVERVVVYGTKEMRGGQSRDRDLLVRLLQYMDTPQYLRRHVFARTPSLKYAGLLPPLRTRSHPLAARVADLRPGDTRWGMLVGSNTVDLGLDEKVRYSGTIDRHTPQLFRVVRTEPMVEIEAVSRGEVDVYWGFETDTIQDLPALLKSHREHTVIVFSRRGTVFNSLRDKIIASISHENNVLAVFGGPKRGVHELVGSGHPSMEQVGYWVNSVVGQGTETVRLEEAILIGLGLLNDAAGHLYARPGYYDA